MQLASGMAYVHSQHILHRDLKSENCMLRAEDRSVVIVDFGLARVLQGQVLKHDASSQSLRRRQNQRSTRRNSSHDLTAMTPARAGRHGGRSPDSAAHVRSSSPPPAPSSSKRRARLRSLDDIAQAMSVVGSPFWMAPEMMKGTYGLPADVFSFGIVACEVIGRCSADPDVMPRTSNFGMDEAAFRADFAGGCPPTFLAIAFRCASVQPEERPTFAQAEALLRGIWMRRNPALPPRLAKASPTALRAAAVAAAVMLRERTAVVRGGLTKASLPVRGAGRAAAASRVARATSPTQLRAASRGESPEIPDGGLARAAGNRRTTPDGPSPTYSSPRAMVRKVQMESHLRGRADVSPAAPPHDAQALAASPLMDGAWHTGNVSPKKDNLSPKDPATPHPAAAGDEEHYSGFGVVCDSVFTPSPVRPLSAGPSPAGHGTPMRQERRACDEAIPLFGLAQEMDMLQPGDVGVDSQDDALFGSVAAFERHRRPTVQGHFAPIGRHGASSPSARDAVQPQSGGASDGRATLAPRSRTASPAEASPALRRAFLCAMHLGRGSAPNLRALSLSGRSGDGGDDGGAIGGDIEGQNVVFAAEPEGANAEQAGAQDSPRDAAKPRMSFSGWM
jgi:serine/threonine protein kinase